MDKVELRGLDVPAIGAARTQWNADRAKASRHSIPSMAANALQTRHHEERDKAREGLAAKRKGIEDVRRRKGESP